MSQPLSAENIAYWREQVAADRSRTRGWTDAEVVGLVRRFLATLDIETATAPWLDARRLAEAMRAVDVIEKRPVDSYIPLAMEIAAAYGPTSVPDVLAGVPQREPADVYSGQGAVTDVGPTPTTEPHDA